MANLALIIGIKQYQRLKPLNCAKRDAELMRDYCLNEVNFERVFLFTDDSNPIPAPDGTLQETKPTANNLKSFLHDFFESPRLETGDNFWFFFSGHGLSDQGQDYLVPYDGHPRLIQETTISLNYVTQRLRKCGADNVILLLDTCRNETKFGNKSVVGQKQQGVITIASCSPTKESYQIPELEQSSFTYALLEALRIQGENNCATVERLCNRLRDRVPEINRQYHKPPQNPYAVVEPNYKNHLILLPRQATLSDIALLREEALDLEGEGRLEEAKQLMRRVLALDPTNSTVLRIYERIILKIAQQPIIVSSTPLPTDPKEAKSIQENELKSERGIDYTKLRDLLAHKQWKEAGEETINVMLQVSNRVNEGWLQTEDIDNFPCEDLRTIDQLWVHYSQGKFGFSVQKKIYQSLGGTRDDDNEKVWNAFEDKVGWRVKSEWLWLENNKWVKYGDFTFDLTAPLGHLPFFIAEGLFSRIETCKL